MDNEADVFCHGNTKRPERPEVTMDTEAVSSSAPEKRKSSKPIMEKRRRARINASLTELKTFLLDIIKKEGLRHNKMEKADILELTVKHLRQLQKEQFTNVGKANDSNCDDTFRKGFTECASEVAKFFKSIPDIHPNLQARLLEHLLRYKDVDQRQKYINNSVEHTNKCVQPSTKLVENLQPYTNAPYLFSHNGNIEPVPNTALQYGNVSTSGKQDTRPPQQNKQCESNVIFESGNKSGSMDRNVNSQINPVQHVNLNSNLQLGNMISGLQIIPTRLESGQTAYIIPANIVTNTCIPNYIVPVLPSSCINLSSKQLIHSGQPESVSISRTQDNISCSKPVTSKPSPLPNFKNSSVTNSQSLNSFGLHNGQNNNENAEVSNLPALQNMNHAVIDSDVWRPW